jgi:hypothetical protein
MDTKEVLLLLGLIIEVLKDLVTWLSNLGSVDPPLENIAVMADWFVALGATYVLR